MRLLRVAGALLLTFCAREARAYPWMIRHHYTGCASCHVDPSGAGLLTPYGRAQQELLVTTHYGKSTEELNPPTGLLDGLIQAPDWLNAGLSFRGGELVNHVPQATAQQWILMIADLRGEVSAGPVHAVATLGFDPQGAILAAVTNQPTDNLVSREHWIGVDLASQSVMVRAGRMEVPYGLRNVEHPAWVRSETRTDINSAQQHGVSVAYNVEGFRAELMGIAGNFQVRQPSYREHGYAGYAEGALLPNLTLGVSSLVTQAGNDLITSGANTLRQAHGLFSRWAVVEPLVLLAEVDALVKASQGVPTDLGYASFLQADYEPIQGVHFYLTGESLLEQGQSSFGGWASVSYFFFSNAELRIDSIWRRNGTPAGPFPTLTVLAQLHISF